MGDSRKWAAEEAARLGMTELEYANSCQHLEVTSEEEEAFKELELRLAKQGNLTEYDREAQLGVRNEGTARDFAQARLTRRQELNESFYIDDDEQLFGINGPIIDPLIGATIEYHNLRGGIQFDDKPTHESEIPVSGGVGDIDSDAKGSGARFNEGKRPLELVPVDTWKEWLYRVTPHDQYVEKLFDFFDALAVWQSGEQLAEDLLEYFDASDMANAAHVFDFGRRKYKEWNWAKGMPWSVPTACIMRHAEAILLDNQELDDDSGLPHIGHLLCNVIMLVHYERYYTEGDDRPPREIFNA